MFMLVQWRQEIGTKGKIIKNVSAKKEGKMRERNNTLKEGESR